MASIYLLDCALGTKHFALLKDKHKPGFWTRIMDDFAKGVVRAIGFGTEASAFLFYKNQRKGGLIFHFKGFYSSLL